MEKIKEMLNEVKDFFMSWYNGQRDSMLWGIGLLIVAIILVVIFCGIFGNNDQNFFYKEKKTIGIEVEEMVQVDTTINLVSEDAKPRPPFYPKETPPVKKGLNIVNGKIVIKS